MATPVGHALSGLSLYVLTRGGGGRPAVPLREAAAVVLVACLPDSDFIPGLIMGDASLWHHRFSHSLFFAAAVSVCIMAAAVLLRTPGEERRRWAGLAGGLLLLHLGIDLVTEDPVPPFGMRLWWPVSGAHVLAPWSFIHSANRGPVTVERLRNWAGVGIAETAIFGSALLGAWYGRRHGSGTNA